METPLTRPEARRLLLVGALPYPHHQGSQVYLQEQAIALRAAGAEVDLLTYASQGPIDADDERGRATDGFRHLRPPAWTAPKRIRSGPALGKPRADLAMTLKLNDALASKKRLGSPYDAILTHNIEACVIASLQALFMRDHRVPFIYCAHTLLEEELGSYLGHRAFIHSSEGSRRPFSARSALADLMGRIGRALDRWAPSAADGWIALTQDAARVMKNASNSPGCVIPPPIPDPECARSREDLTRLMPSYGLEPNAYFLYSGNLDAYQELDLLLAADRQRPASNAVRIVVASHEDDPRFADRARAGADQAGLRRIEVRNAAQMRALIECARATVVPRRSAGGFPIKIVNSLAAGTAPIVFRDREWGLQSGRDALVAAGRDPVDGLARALDCLAREPDRARRLGEGARATYLRNHQPERAAAATLALIEEVIAGLEGEPLRRAPRDGERSAGLPD